MSGYLYALGDADDVRKMVQGYLLSGDLDSLRVFSSNLTIAIRELSEVAAAVLKAEVIFSGGDDVLLRFNFATFRAGSLVELMHKFKNRCGATISFGLGKSTEEAFLNLARAKARGPGTLLFDSDDARQPTSA